jgi:Ca-activated chloride channel family protein
MPGEFHFLRPGWLLTSVPLLIFLLWFARRRYERRRWQGIVDPALMPHVLIGAAQESRRRIAVLLAVAGALVITALAGPVWERLPRPVFRSQDALVIALDLSRSMDVADVTPSRLERARFKLSDILERRAEGQTGLLVYAAEPFVISPLTDDTRTISAQLPAMTTNLMPSQGSRADRALEQAADLLHQAGAGDGHVLLVSDGADARRVEPVARRLRDSGIRISVLGVGTVEGGPVPGPDGFLQRADGSIVIAKADAAGLQSIARAGGGRYVSLTADGRDVDRLLAGMTGRPDTTEDSGLTADVWREEGPWLLLPLLPLAALAFRRGVIAIWLIAFMLPVRPAAALELADLWSRPDQRASALLEAGEAGAAAELFTDPAWKGTAAYRAGRYEDSLAALEGLDTGAAIYNRGNALARLGRYDEAIAAYESALERDAGNDDARHNLDLLRSLQQQSQQQGDGASSEAADGSPDEGRTGDQQADDGQAQGAGQQERSAAPDQPGQTGPSPDSAPGAPKTGSGSGDAVTDRSSERESAAESLDDAATASDASGSPPGGAQDQAAAMAEAQQDGPGDDAGDAAPAMARSDEQPPDEEALATEQWLRKIPDDPGGLLRRKFYYQYQQRGGARQEEEPW